MITPTSELEAVNTILSTIGESPINSLAGERTSEVSIASNTLSEVSRQVQTLGWPWNTDEEYTLELDADGGITLADNLARVVISATRYPTIQPVQRGSRLYDRKGHTYTFDQPIIADTVVTLLSFDELPEAARQYILIRSCRLFQDRVVGSDSLHQYTLEDEMSARAALFVDQAETQQYSMLQNYDIANTLRRS